MLERHGRRANHGGEGGLSQLKTEILCTISPNSAGPGMLERLEELGVNLFRINLSHTKLQDLPEAIREIQRRTRVPVCLDTEGAQIRTGDLATPCISARENATVTAVAEPIVGDEHRFAFYPAEVVELLEEGDFLTIDFDGVLVQVMERRPGLARLRVINGGKIGRNKAVTTWRSIPLPPLTEKDRTALRLGADMGIRHIALSFASAAQHVTEIRRAFGRPAFVISKIETRQGLRHLDDIIGASDAILIDRGDLSREVPIERLPALQKAILERAKINATKVYVATNLLESMTTVPQPTRAEVNDVYNTLMDGAAGLVLAAETAIGRYPIGCVSMIRRIIHEFERPAEPERVAHSSDVAFSLLVPPHGGVLISREADDAQRREAETLPRLMVEPDDLADCQQLATGTYSPLMGFMDAEALASVLADYRLPDGTIWPLPILLQVPQATAARLAAGDRVVLTDEGGIPLFRLDVSAVYAVDLERVANAWFGSTREAHPGVARFYRRGPYCVGGRVTLLRRLSSEYRSYDLAPAQSRLVFAHKGWIRVVGFHTRNVCHRAHEHIMLEALRRTYADGLYITPVLGTKKTGDFRAGAILQAYELLLSELDVFAPGTVVLGGFSTYSRYAGAREAVFTALCRKNMGCSHFIVGRDHTGAGAVDGTDPNRRLFDRLGDLGIEPVFFDEIGYHPVKGSYEPVGRAGVLKPISGTMMRNALTRGDPLPEWFIRPDIQALLRSKLANGEEVFVRDLDTAAAGAVAHRRPDSEGRPASALPVAS
jgi:pyruvate kinase